MKTKRKLLQVRMDDETHEKFSALAKEQDSNKSEIIRKFIIRIIRKGGHMTRKEGEEQQTD